MIKYLFVLELGCILPLAASTWNITSFGALGNGVHDDTRAVQSAVNACRNGDTVILPPGTYKINSTLYLRPNCTYQGQNSPVLLGYTGFGAGGYLLAEGYDISNISISGIVFNGGGIHLVASSQIGHDITITQCAFQNIQSAGNYDDGLVHTAIYIEGAAGWRNLVITTNTFTNITYAGQYLNCLPTDPDCNNDYEASNGIVVYRAVSYELDDNTFNNVNEGIKIMEDPYFYVPRLGPFNIIRNTFNGIHRIAIESQDGSPGYCINNFHADYNNITSFVAPSWITMAISVPLWCVGDRISSVSHNTINLNPAGTVPPADGVSFNYGIGIELGVPVMDSNVIQAASGAFGVAWFVSDFLVSSMPATISNKTICGPTVNSSWWGKDYSQGWVADPVMWNNTYTSNCAK
jgi:hypothetical protein